MDNLTGMWLETIISLPSSLAQRQSGRLLTARFEVQILGEELFNHQKSANIKIEYAKLLNLAIHSNLQQLS